MNYIENIKPGDIVVSNFGKYQHWSIVSDKKCSKNKNMLISATDRNGNVEEEPWDEVTNGKYTYVTKTCDDNTREVVLSKARSFIGKWKYSLIDRNCEHFANYVFNNKMESKQVKGGVLGMMAGGIALKLVSDKPKPLDFLIAGGLGLLFGIACNKAIIEKS